MGLCVMKYDEVKWVVTVVMVKREEDVDGGRWW